MRGCCESWGGGHLGTHPCLSAHSFFGKEAFAIQAPSFGGGALLAARPAGWCWGSLLCCCCLGLLLLCLPARLLLGLLWVGSPDPTAACPRDWPGQRRPSADGER
ncbi:hypothetical protein M758_3G270700 [Ceratodon purpureus]|nr:hypothetical protein M758_3G270700 [Ceratodon purpureus]